MATLGTFTAGSVLTAAELNAIGTYTDYSSSVTFSGFTKGNATVVAKYTKINKFVHYWGVVTLGSTSSMSGALDVYLPFTATGGNITNNSACSFYDASGTLYWGTAFHIGTTEIRLQIHVASTTYASNTDVSSIKPFTWTTNDQFFWNHSYEAA